MSPTRLSRGTGHGRSASPVRLVHLGLGNFFRAHQCWYTEHAGDAAGWGFIAFTGRSASPVVDDLVAQDGLYTLVSRAADADRFEVIGSLSRVHQASDHEAWLRYFASPEVVAATVTVTEAGYLRGPGGGLDIARPEVQADLDALRHGATGPAGPVRTAPGRLLAGLAARRRADAGPFTLVPCDNTPGNGALVERILGDLAEAVDDGLAGWLRESVTVVTTMVDRITPRTTADDVRAVAAATGVDDRCPVVTEPFHEWVLSGAVPGGLPRWEDAGATFTDDVTPYEHRKLWLLNGAHSLLAYAGQLRGHATVAKALADPGCREAVEAFWDEAEAHLSGADLRIGDYRAALLARFGNARIAHNLAQIAMDGSTKLRLRAVPVLRAERAAGRTGAAAARMIAAWADFVATSEEIADPLAESIRLANTLTGRARLESLLRLLDPDLPGEPGTVELVAGLEGALRAR